MARRKRSLSPPEAGKASLEPDLLKPNHPSVSPDTNGEKELGVAPSMLKPRAYQEEMLAESLRQNIIIAMDTGSGKTQMWVPVYVPEALQETSFIHEGSTRGYAPIDTILTIDTVSAALRIREELGRCSPEKLIWFIAPTVALAEQQHAVLSLQLPAFQTKMLSGADNVERWTTQKIWDAILLNIKIVVSTPQVLLDALSNGFLKLTRMALLVFDEAHHCVASSAGNRIMQNFYHPLKASGSEDVPSILGLTASPVTKGNIGGLEKIEANLDAICRTPKVHREEMMQYVHRPELETVTFERSNWAHSAIMQGLLTIRDQLDIQDDPLVKRLKSDESSKSQEALVKILEKRKTPCQTQLKMFFARAETIHSELGPWAADWFVMTCIERVQVLVEGKSRGNVFIEWEHDEKAYISSVLSRVPGITSPKKGIPDVLSDKTDKLIRLLVSGYSPGFRGIVFAQQRSTVVMLSHLLSNHPLLADITPGSFVGDSSYAGKKTNITELTSPDDQKEAISDLRTGKKNLLIATSVLEEGIDVSACNLVVCFDPPSNLRSFIQRRGRARKEASKFIIFLNENDSDSLLKWTKMEKIMKDVYSDDMRELEEMQAREDILEDGTRYFPIESTGALLTLDNARQHLDHFCSTLACSYAETRPEFIMIEDPVEGYFTARVELPSLIDPSLREAKGLLAWKTEKMAKRDAAFQAYVKLYEAGLVNDHLLPRHCESRYRSCEKIEKRTNFDTVQGSINPWIAVAQEWQKGSALYQTSIDIVSGDLRLPPILLLLPVASVCHIPFKLFWNEETIFNVSFTQNTARIPPDIVPRAANVTHLLLSSMFSSRMPPERKDFPWLFLPQIELTSESIESWYTSMEGVIPAHELLSRDQSTFAQLGLARTIYRPTRPIIIEKGIWMEPIDEDKLEYEEDVAEDEAVQEYHVEGLKIPKRTDFLHPVISNNPAALAHTARRCIPARLCSIDKLPATYARVASFIPSIIHKMEVSIVAQELSQTTLASIGFEDLSLVAMAISTSSAREEFNYQRIEFLGDSLLKLHTSLQLAAVNPLWPEGLLSHGKDLIVSNTRLSKAAVEVGLDRFILTRAFTGSKWRPLYISDLLEIGARGIPGRELSTKVLADVVEALIGAANLDGGEERTIKCLQLFLPEMKWVATSKHVELLHSQAPEPNDRAPLAMVPEVESMVGYTFGKKMLLAEALTHPCSKGSTMSYQRLEFVGDSILDHIVVHEIFHSPEEYAHYDMHLMRTVLVNADFLAFLCLDTFLEEKRGEVEEIPPQNKSARKVEISVKETVRKRYLWQFMNHSASWEISNAQQTTFKQYGVLRDSIIRALEESPTYPWALLSRLDAGKFFSDLIESLLGGVFIDSRGSLDACRKFLENIGLMRYVRYVTTGKIHRLLHPKQRLGHQVGRATVTYDANLGESGEGKARGWVCRVLVDDECMVEVGDGVSRLEVETRAADAALHVLDMKETKENQGEVGVGEGDSYDDDRDEITSDA